MTHSCVQGTAAVAESGQGRLPVIAPPTEVGDKADKLTMPPAFALPPIKKGQTLVGSSAQNACGRETQSGRETSFESRRAEVEISDLNSNCVNISVFSSNYRRENRPILAAIVSDQVAGHPFEVYLRKTSMGKQLANLQFWGVAENYIALRRCAAVGDAYDALQQLCARVVLSHFQHNKNRLATALALQLEQGQWEDILREQQDTICKVRRRGNHPRNCI